MNFNGFYFVIPLRPWQTVKRGLRGILAVDLYTPLAPLCVFFSLYNARLCSNISIVVTQKSDKIYTNYPSINPSSSAYRGSGSGGSRLNRVFRLSLSPAMLSSSSWRTPESLPGQMRTLGAPSGCPSSRNVDQLDYIRMCRDLDSDYFKNKR